MLRRLSAIAAAAAMIGLCTLPATLPASASTTAAHATTHKFTVPTIKHHNVVTAWGSYTRVSPARVVINICAKQTGRAFAVGAIAVASKANGASKNIAAVVLEQRVGTTFCGHMSFIFYTAHLKVYAFVGAGGHIIAKSAVKKIY
jgi:hypothetical protein